MTKFTDLNTKELMNTDGGVFGIDDAIFWGAVVGMFAAGAGCGVAAGVSRKNRQ